MYGLYVRVESITLLFALFQLSLIARVHTGSFNPHLVLHACGVATNSLPGRAIHVRDARVNDVREAWDFWNNVPSTIKARLYPNLKQRANELYYKSRHDLS